MSTKKSVDMNDNNNFILKLKFPQSKMNCFFFFILFVVVVFLLYSYNDAFPLMNIYFHIFHIFKLFHLDLKTWTAILPSLEFMNFIVALIVWSSRYPSVFWSTSKSFAFIFSIQMIANAIDLLLVFAGVTVIYKLQIVGQKLPLQV